LVKAWESMLADVMVSQSFGMVDPYPGAGPVQGAFWRTALGNWILEEFPVVVVTNEDGEAFDDFAHHSAKTRIYLSLRDMVKVSTRPSSSRRVDILDWDYRISRAGARSGFYTAEMFP